MSIIKEIVKQSNSSGATFNFKLSISNNNKFTGYQQEIDNLTQYTSTDLVNSVVDGETRKFGYANQSPLVIKFDFFSILVGTGAYSSTFSSPPSPVFNIGSNMFTTDEITSNSDNFLNSFFMLDFYDSYDINNQTKIFRTYLTKKGTEPVYNIDVNNQLYYWYVPISYLTGTTRIGYVKFSFYNAKYGTTALFYNKDNESLLTPERLYFKAELNILNKTWYFISPYSSITAKEFSNNPLYVNRVNATYSNYNVTQQTYPTGNTLTYSSGKAGYEIT